MTSYSTVLVGPWGTRDGAAWNYVAKGKICRISVTYDANTIHSIKFTSIDKNGNLDSSGVFGGPNGTQSKEIVIDTNLDELEKIDGIVGANGSTRVVTSLTFTTRNNTKYGPFGSENGTAFSLRLTKDSFSGFHGFCGELLNSIGVSIPFTTGDFLPPWGGTGGVPWSYQSKEVISHITITYNDDVIHTLRFASKDVSGNLHYSDVFGLSNEGKTHEIQIDTTVEKLIGITGTFGIHAGAKFLTSLTFVTDKRKSYGPFGGEGDTPFSDLVQGDEILAGFHGQAGKLIDSIGIYKKPANLTSVLVGPTFGFRGNGRRPNKYSFEPKGSITRIIITWTEIIQTLQFEGLDENGKPVISPIFGEPAGDKREVINIAPDEKIIGINGFVADRAQHRIVSSLSISTDKKIIYGPYGTTRGTEFSFPIKDGYISGFEGDYGGTIISIGAYIKPK